MLLFAALKFIVGIVIYKKRGKNLCIKSAKNQKTMKSLSKICYKSIMAICAIQYTYVGYEIAL